MIDIRKSNPEKLGTRRNDECPRGYYNWLKVELLVVQSIIIANQSYCLDDLPLLQSTSHP